MGNSDIELLYFPMHGRGLVARLILDYGKVDYNNKTITFPEFAALKPSKLITCILLNTFEKVNYIIDLKIF